LIGPSSIAAGCTVPPRDYRMTRRLTPDEQKQVVDLYRLGTSTYQMARQFGSDRHTITGHLRRGGVSLRSRRKLTPQLTEQAKQLYAEGRSLAVIGVEHDALARRREAFGVVQRNGFGVVERWPPR
jgi:hypothetical protein